MASVPISVQPQKALVGTVSLPAFMLHLCLEGAQCVVHLAGELDLSTRDQVFVAATAGGHEAMVVDLTELRFMDCSGFAGLVASRLVVEGTGGTFALRGQSGQPARLLDRIAALGAEPDR